jgi:large subunit ribosomal protein L4
MLIGAMRSALSAQLAAGALKVVKAFEVDSHKTKEFGKVLSALETGATVLLVDDGDNRNLALSSRNLPGVTLVRGRDLHPYHLLRHEQVIFSQAAVEKCGEVLA